MSVYNMSGDTYFDLQNVPIEVLNFKNHGNSQCHTHSFYEFVYIEHGFALHTYNDVTTILTPGDLFAIRPGDIHGYSSTKNTNLYNCLFFSEALKDVWDEVMSLSGVHQVFDSDEPSVWKRIHLDLPKQKQVVEYLEKMRWEASHKNQGWELNIKSLLIGFLVLFSRAYDDCYGLKESGDCKYYNYVYNALSFIESYFKENISVNDIASAVGLSGDYLTRQFKQFTGMTTIEYIRNFRFAKALEMLKDPAVSISEVASEVGYDDPCYFTRQFKQMLKMSPSEYRRMGIKEY